MPDVFISYSKKDRVLAEFMASHLMKEDVSVFMAALSLKPGQDWSNEIIGNLKHSSWVIFLASEAACNSPYVQQELGMALATQKNLVPVVWDMDVAKLPGWVNRKQALDLRSCSLEDARERITAIAKIIRKNSTTGLLIAGLLVAGLIFLLTRKG